MNQLSAAILNGERFEQNGGSEHRTDIEFRAAEQQMFHDRKSSTEGYTREQSPLLMRPVSETGFRSGS